MKKFVCVMLSVIMTLSLAACGQTGGPSSESSSSEETAAEETASSEETSAEEAAGSSGSETSSEEAGSGSAQETAGGAEGGRVLVAYFSWSGNTREMASYIAQQTGGDLLEIQPAVPYPEDYNECGDVALAERDNNERPAIANLPASMDTEQFDNSIAFVRENAGAATVHDGLFTRPSDTEGIDAYLSANGLIQ